MASSVDYRAQLHHLRQGYLSRQSGHEIRPTAPPAVVKAPSPVVVQHLIDLTSYEEEYDYLVARRRAVSSGGLRDAVTRTRDEHVTTHNTKGASAVLPKVNIGGGDDDKAILGTLGLSTSESNQRPSRRHRDDKAARNPLDTDSALPSTPRSASSVSTPSKMFPSSVSLQIRQELEEIKTITTLGVGDDDSQDKHSIIRLEDILRSDKKKSSGADNSLEREAYSPDPIPTTPSLEAEYNETGKKRGRRHRNDPDKLRVLTPEPIPTTPSLETELTLRSPKGSTSAHHDGSFLPGSVDIEVNHAVNPNGSGELPQPTSSLKKLSHRAPLNTAEDRIDSHNDGRGQGEHKQNASKSVSFHGETKPIISVVDTDGNDLYGEMEIRGGSGPEGGSESVWSPSSESDLMPGSTSMYRRAIMARRRKNAARSGIGGFAHSGPVPTSTSASMGAFKPILREYEETDDLERKNQPLEGRGMAEKYRSLAISPVKSSMDQEDSFWILSPSPRKSPEGGHFREADMREDEDEERSSIEGDKRDKHDDSKVSGGQGMPSPRDSASPLPSSKSLSPSVERRALPGAKEFDFDDIRAAKSLSFRLKSSEIANDRMRVSPPAIDIEARSSGVDLEVDKISSNFARASSPRDTSPRLLQASPQLSEGSLSSRRLQTRSNLSDNASREDRVAKSPDYDPSVDAEMSSTLLKGSVKEELELVSEIPSIPAAKSEPGGWKTRDADPIRVEDLEVPQVMTEPKRHSASARNSKDAFRGLTEKRSYGALADDEIRSTPSKFVSEFLTEPVFAPDLTLLSSSMTESSKPLVTSPRRARVTPETPNRPTRSIVQQKLSVEINRKDERIESASQPQTLETIEQPRQPVIDAEDFSNVVNGGGGEIKAIDSVNKLVNSFDDDDDGATGVTFEAPIPKPYSKDLAISESESSSSQIESDSIVTPTVEIVDGHRLAITAHESLPLQRDPIGTVTPQAPQESDYENTSGEDSYAVGQRRYNKYSSDENGGQTSGNETDSKLSIINSESSESELGVDPDLDPHVLYDSEAMRFVVQILDSSCAWLEDDGCGCNYQGQPASLLREIKRKSRVGPISTKGLDHSQVSTPRVSNSQKSRVSGKASSLVRLAAKQNPGGPLVQKLQTVKERRSQRSSNQGVDPPDDGEGSTSKISVFARPRRRQTSPRRQAFPDSDTGSSDEPVSAKRSPPRRRRSHSPRKRSSATSPGTRHPIASAPVATPVPVPMVESEQPGSFEVQDAESELSVSPFQKKLQERLASVRGQSQSDSSVGPEAQESSPIASGAVRDDAEQAELPATADFQQHANRTASPFRAKPSERLSSVDICTRNPTPTQGSPANSPRLLSIDSSENVLRATSPTKSPSRISDASHQPTHTPRQPENDTLDNFRGKDASFPVPLQGPSSRELVDKTEARDQRARSRKVPSETRSRGSSRKSKPKAKEESPSSSNENKHHQRVVAPPLDEQSRRHKSSGSYRISGSGGPEQSSSQPRSDVSAGRSAASFSASSLAPSSSFVSSRMSASRGRLDTIPESNTPASSTASSPSSHYSSSPFHGLTESERLAALELAEKLRRRAANLKRRRRAREKRMNQFLVDEEDEEDEPDPAMS